MTRKGTLAFIIAFLNSIAWGSTIDAGSRDFLTRKEVICTSALKQHVPAELVAGVILAENNLNKNWLDTIQNALFRGILKYHDTAWWSHWAKHSMALAKRDQAIRLSTNKWSNELIATGFVFSVGPAQITPRTAIIACDNVSDPPPLCKINVKTIVAGLLEYEGAIEIAATVLRYEAESHKLNTGDDLSKNLGLWATLYNIGGDYFRQEKDNGIPNKFGQWIESHARDIAQILACP